MVQDLEQYYEQYEKAQNDPEQMEEWQKWGDRKYQACQNKRDYDQYKECGFTEEPTFNKYGWVNTRIPKDTIEEIKIFGEEGGHSSSVECAQLPNGKWVSGYGYFLSISGASCGCSIWGKQYDSRIKALTDKIRQIVDHIKRSDRATDRTYLPKLYEAMDNVRQLSLF